MIHRHWASVAVLLLFVAASSFADAPKQGGLESLKDFVGKYPPDVKLWDTRPLHDRLTTLLGAQYATFLANMRTNGKIAAYGDVVWTSGIKPHMGSKEAALFLADTKAGVIEVYLLSKGKLAHHAEKGAAIPLEGDAKTALSHLQESATRR